MIERKKHFDQLSVL